MRKSFIDKIKSGLPAGGFFALVCGVILWQLFLPGYVLTLDMVFAPRALASVEPTSLGNTQPLQFLLAMVSAVMPGWVIQKIILGLLFFTIGLSAYIFLPLPSNRSRYWAGLFYLVNPFVYTRFLAGQWLLLAGYALLPIGVGYFIAWLRAQRWRDTFILAIIIGLIGIFSAHLAVSALIIILIVTSIGGIILLLKRQYLATRRLFSQLVALTCSVAILWSYWLIPILINTRPAVSSIGAIDREVFATAVHPVLGGVLGVVALFGFWGENQPWGRSFLWPDHLGIVWFPSAIILALVIIGGWYSAYRRSGRVFLLLTGITLVTLIASLGEATAPTRALHAWLYDHVWWWRGFRDSQKWSAFLVLIYAIAGGYGLEAFIRRTQLLAPRLVNPLIGLVFLATCFYTITELGGFARQLKPVWYPNSWHEADTILKNDPTGLTIFLPWHQYLSLSFNHNIITLNPARAFFGQRLIQSERPDFGALPFNGSAVALTIDKIITQIDSIPPSDSARALSQVGVRYILASGELAGQGLGANLPSILNQYLEIVYVDQGLTLYRFIR